VEFYCFIFNTFHKQIRSVENTGEHIEIFLLQSKVLCLHANMHFIQKHFRKSIRPSTHAKRNYQLYKNCFCKTRIRM